jgi:hypothetical protein
MIDFRGQTAVHFREYLFQSNFYTPTPQFRIVEPNRVGSSFLAFNSLSLYVFLVLDHFESIATKSYHCEGNPTYHKYIKF